MSPVETRREPVARFAFVGIAVVAGLVYAISTPGWVLGGDNGEFVTLFAKGGVAHPPGYPLFVMLLRAFAWLPVSPPRGAALVTAMLGMLSILALYRACRAWGASEGAAAIATSVYASSSLAWRLNSAAEVFGLNVLIACAIVIVAAPGNASRGWKRSAQLGFLAGLGLSNHHSIVLLAPVGLCAFYGSVREEPHKWRSFVAGLVALAIGLLPYAYLYDRALHADPSTAWVWGNVHDVPSLIEHFRRAEFGTTRLSLRHAPLEPLAQLRAFVVRLTTDLLGLPLVMLVGAFASLRRVRVSVVLLGLSLVLAGPVFVAIFNIAPRGVAALIIERFYLLPMALTCVLGALALSRLLPALDRRSGVAAGVSAMILVTGFALGAARISEDHRPTIEMYVKNTLRGAPPSAIIVGSGDQKFAGFLYARRVLGLRSDVDFITPEMLFGKWYFERASRTLGIPLSPPTADRVTLITELLATGRPVAFAGPVAAPLLDAGFGSYPMGTLQMVSPKGVATPDVHSLEAANVHLLEGYELEPLASATSASWAGATFGEYARSWLVLESRYGLEDDTARAKRCHDRAVAFAPWLVK